MAPTWAGGQSSNKRPKELESFSASCTNRICPHLRMEKIRVTIWNEFVHERENPHVVKIYPKGIHATLAAALEPHADLQIRTRTLQDPDQGLGADILES